MPRSSAVKSHRPKSGGRRHLQSASRRKTTPLAIITQFAQSPKGSVAIVGAFLSIACLYLTNTDTVFNYRWFNLAMWLGSVAAFFYVCKEKWETYNGPAKLYLVYSKNSGTKATKSKNTYYKYVPIAAVAVLTTILSFVYLNNYPFAGDNITEVGATALAIARGEIRNLFGTTPNNNFGTVSLLLNTLFYNLFTDGLTPMRLPAALVGIADVCLLFYVVRANFNTRTAVWTGLVMATLPLHLYFARVNTAVIFTSFWATAILGATLWAWKQRTILSFGMLGLTLGLAAGFNIDVRTMATMSFGLITISAGFATYRLSSQKTQFWGKFALLCAMCFVGYGPQLWNTNQNNFVGTDRTPAFQGGNLVDGVTTGVKNVPNSFAKLVDAPLAENTVMGNAPVLQNYGLALFFVVGFLAALFTSNPALRIIAGLTVALVTFCFGFTNTTNFTEKAMIVFPAISFLTAYGIVRMVDYFGQFSIPNSEKAGKNFMGDMDPAFFLKKNRMISRVLSVVTVLAAGYFMAMPVTNYFKNETASNLDSGNSSGNRPAYLMNHVVKAMMTQGVGGLEKDVCITVSNANAEVLNLPQNREYFSYFMPRGTQIQVKALAEAGETDAYVARNCVNEVEGLTWNKQTPCENYRRYSCPNDGTQFNIYTDSQMTALN